MTVEAGRAAALASTDSGFPLATLFRHGSLTVEFYAPHGEDRQQPHARDEVYVIASGAATYVCADGRHPAETGEVLFAAAGAPHHFENMTDDFGTWVFFYGPVGGEGEAVEIPLHP